MNLPQPNVSYSVGAGASGVAIGDFNRDGKLDIVNTNYNSNTIFAETKETRV